MLEYLIVSLSQKFVSENMPFFIYFLIYQG